MDELKSFFNNPCPSSSQIKKIRGPLTGGLRITKEDTTAQLNRREEHRRAVVPSGTDYAREIKQRETDMYKRNEAEKDKWESISGGLESMEQLSLWGMSMPNIGELTEEAMTTVYNKYTFKKREDTIKLAIEEYKQEILDGIGGFSVVIIEGPTGCGKTTQVPQWILDDSYQKRKPCKIIVTQPRRIAAISIAKRVAQERGWDVGGLVGYQVGLENRTTTDTRIHYVTTGLLLQKLVAAKTMNEYTHVILDEVHERGQEMDFLLLLVKRLLYTVSPKVKVILMSATFKWRTFADYFLIPTIDGQMASAINIVKKDPTFTVKTFYLNNLTKFGSILLQSTPKGDPTIAPEMFHLVIKLLNAFEHIDKQEDHYEDRSQADLPSVLIFLPGINEIEDLFLCLSDLKLRQKVADAECATYKWWVLPLHSTITADEQVRVFQRAPPGHRKIILATNIAESSITVPDIKYVIDFCLIKILVADEHTNFTSLQMCWASKTNCEQRAGRAGRVRDGRVYRLVTDKFYEGLSQEGRPEILRCPLERLVLLAKMLDMGQPSDVLALAMDPPDMSNIHRTILVLKEIGALRKTLAGEWSQSDGDITYLGRIMAKLPLDVRASKLIVLGYIFGCLDEALVMAASISVKNLFSNPFRERLNAYNSKLTWADGSTSDCIAFLNVYKVWTHLRQQQYFRQQHGNEVQWARRFYVQIRSLKELDDLVRELKLRLSREGIDISKEGSPWDKNELALVLKIIMAGAVYPQYFVQVSQDESRERDAVRILGGHDPRNTVYLKNFPDNQPGEIYAASIKRAVRQQIGDEPRVTFDKNSRKVYLTFQVNSGRGKHNETQTDPTIPGQVVLPVYKAIKARQLKMDIRIQLLPLEKANEVAAALESEKKMEHTWNKMVPRLPDVDDSHFPLTISEKISVSKFWVQYDDTSTASELRQIQNTLNRAKLIPHNGPVAVGDIFAGPFVDTHGTTMHRIRVQRLLPRDMFEVLFIDYGNTQRLNTCNLYLIPPGICQDTPPLAMECVLAEIAPSPLINQHGQWTPRARQLFDSLIAKGHLLGKVYSVTHGIVSIELLADGGRISVNKELVNQRLAVPAEESYDSKINHDLRQTATDLNLAQKRAFNKEQTELSFYNLREIEPPNSKDCITDVVLKGPFSPLETIVHNLMYSSREKQVTIEWLSVNSVLLDTDPQEVYERLLVAAEVGQNENSSKLTLRHTTLLPNIPALPAIISLLFCPVAELRRDSEGSRYVSVLCGLGSMEDGTPYFPEHDLLVNIDADLTVEDIGAINHIRYLMDYMMYCNEGQDMPADNAYRSQVPKTIRNDILELFRKRRKHREPESVVNAWEWKTVPEHELLEISVPDMVDQAIIYPLHTPLELRPLSRDQLLKLKEENAQLKLLVARTPISSTGELTCKLCGTGPMPAHAMRIHLYSNAHKEKEEDFRMFES
ncbi:probable ATP-dependent RNA helicase spindle-E [Hyposmocoma kahamanoa]|uniref:probable ATP-dependent RNA helicase spindle-E n=1 Tax=Hyposmocoma kahamanoa TaxID=1477025 RepID=UPI000E6D84F1|nr:probable ATP-dependent RNA helicase spindle-E [Hyposmocoma kahamanoa]